MYNRLGLQTPPRGSGTNVQSNKFFLTPKNGTLATVHNIRKAFKTSQGAAGVTKKPNCCCDILKSNIDILKLVVLEDKLTAQGFTDAEIAEKLDEARATLEEAARAAAAPATDEATGSQLRSRY